MLPFAGHQYKQQRDLLCMVVLADEGINHEELRVRGGQHSLNVLSMYHRLALLKNFSCSSVAKIRSMHAYVV